MNGHVVFPVHGMGDFKKEWSKDAIEQLKTNYGKYNVGKLAPVDTQL